MRTVRINDEEIGMTIHTGGAVDELVVEFSRGGASGAFAAVVVPDGEGWSSAVISIDPEAGDLPVALIAGVIEVAEAEIAVARPSTDAS